MISRRRICIALGTGAFVTPVASFAQTRPPTVGFIEPQPAGSVGSRAGLAAFEQGMREAGWVAGKTFHLEYRSANGRPEQYAPLAAEMVRLGPNVILTYADALIREVAKATTSIPIVMALVGDPVVAGFAKSLARPGGNITGMSNLAVALIGKWVELLAELTPRGSTYGVLRNATNTTHDRFWTEAEAGAAATGNKLLSFGYRRSTCSVNRSPLADCCRTGHRGPTISAALPPMSTRSCVVPRPAICRLNKRVNSSWC